MRGLPLPASLHVRVPVTPDAVIVEVPLQLSTTDRIGAAGVVFGAAKPAPFELVQPFNVWVTV